MEAGRRKKVRRVARRKPRIRPGEGEGEVAEVTALVRDLKPPGVAVDGTLLFSPVATEETRSLSLAPFPMSPVL
jgi:hypothetical protein